MALKILVDSWAMLEMLNGTEKGKRVRKEIASASEVLTTPLLISEIYYRMKEKNGEADALKSIGVVQERGRICEISVEIAISAGDIHLNEKLPLVDSFTLAVARKEGAKILTGDPHFRKIKEAIYIGE